MNPADKTAALAALDAAREIIASQPDDPPPDPDPDPDPGPDEEWPDGASWAVKEAWIDARAGAKGPLEVVTSNNVPRGCRISNGILYVDGTILENVAWGGQIRPSPATAAGLTLRNVAAQDVFAGSSDTLARVDLVEDCTFTIPRERVAKTGGWGQGCLNAMRPGFVVRRTLLTGGADGMQCSGGGTVEDTVIRDLTVYGVAPAGTHNDFCQHYNSGTVYWRRVVMRQDLTVGQGGHVNGLFCDGGDHDVEDSSIIVTAPTGTNAWALHAGKNGMGDRLTVRRSKVRGRKIGNVVFEADVDWQAGY